MAIYAFDITPLLAWLSKKSNQVNSASVSKQVAFADDLNGLGTVKSLTKIGGQKLFIIQTQKSHKSS